MCVAENKLILDMLAERFMQVGTATAAFSDSSVYCYNSFLGMPVAREAAAYFIARRFLYDTQCDLTPEEALRAVQPKHVGLGAGAAPLLNALFFALGNPSEACLIPAPYYAAFENDMNVVAGIVPIAVNQSDAVAGPTNEELEKAYSIARMVRRVDSWEFSSIVVVLTLQTIASARRKGTIRSSFFFRILIILWEQFIVLKSCIALYSGREARICIRSLMKSMHYPHTRLVQIFVFCYCGNIYPSTFISHCCERRAIIASNPLFVY